MKLYLELWALLMAAFLVFGIALPWLLSSNDWIDVGLGFLLLFATIPVFFLLVKKIWLLPSIQAFVKKVSK